jgi:PKD repeat protein
MRTTSFVRHIGRPVGVMALAITVSACNLDTQEVPAISGPSEFGMALTLSASPDTVPRDGSSMSVLTLTARDASGRPAAGQRVTLAVSPSYGGTLSAPEVVTGSDGRATVNFTAPESASGLASISVYATPVGQNFDNAVPRTMTIRLIGPEGSTPVTPGALAPRITYSPTDPKPGTKILFDAMGSSATGGATILDYWWDYGDGNNGTGMVHSHAYQLPYTYVVRLTVRDNLGRLSTTTTEVTIAQPEETEDAD